MWHTFSVISCGLAFQSDRTVFRSTFLVIRSTMFWLNIFALLMLTRGGKSVVIGFEEPEFFADCDSLRLWRKFGDEHVTYPGPAIANRDGFITEDNDPPTDTEGSVIHDEASIDNDELDGHSRCPYEHSKECPRNPLIGRLTKNNHIFSRDGLVIYSSQKLMMPDMADGSVVLSMEYAEQIVFDLNTMRNSVAAGHVKGLKKAKHMPQLQWDPFLQYLAGRFNLNADLEQYICLMSDKYEFPGSTITVSQNRINFQDVKKTLKKILGIYQDQLKLFQQPEYHDFIKGWSLKGNYKNIQQIATILSEKADRVGCHIYLKKMKLHSHDTFGKPKTGFMSSYNAKRNIVVCIFSYRPMETEPIYTEVADDNDAPASGCENKVNSSAVPPESFPYLCGKDEKVTPKPDIKYILKWACKCIMTTVDGQGKTHEEVELLINKDKKLVDIFCYARQAQTCSYFKANYPDPVGRKLYREASDYVGPGATLPFPSVCPKITDSQSSSQSNDITVT